MRQKNSLSARLRAVEESVQAALRGGLPVVLPDTATDELQRLRERGIQAYRASDEQLFDLFV